MLKKKLGLEAIEKNWARVVFSVKDFFKIPTSLIIPKGCEKIGDYAFYECNYLKEAIISEGVKEIRDFSFYGCWKLEKVSIPESVEDIREYAFYECMNLREAIIPGSVERIENYAFWGCSNATIILKKSEKDFGKIGNYVFCNCRDVKEEIRS